MDKIRFGIIGCGQITERKYAKVLIDNASYEITAVCDIDEQKAKKSAEKWQARTYYTDYTEMIKTDIDVVLVNTPHVYHAECMIACAEAKKHVLVEKPMAVSMSEIDSMISAAKKNNIKFLSLPFEFSDSYYECMLMIKEGIIGNIVSVQGFSIKGMFPPFPWYLSKNAGIGSIADIGIYSIAAAISIMGPVRSVCASIKSATPEVILADGNKCRLEQDDTGRLLLEWDNNIIGTITCGWGQGDSGTWVHFYGRKGMLTLGGWGNEFLYLKTNDKSSIPEDAEEHPDLFGKKYLINKKECWGKQAIEYLVKAIKDDSDLTRDLERNKHILDVIFQAYESEKNDSHISIHTTF